MAPRSLVDRTPRGTTCRTTQLVLPEGAFELLKNEDYTTYSNRFLRCYSDADKFSPMHGPTLPVLTREAEQLLFNRASRYRWEILYTLQKQGAFHEAIKDGDSSFLCGLSDERKESLRTACKVLNSDVLPCPSDNPNDYTTAQRIICVAHEILPSLSKIVTYLVENQKIHLRPAELQELNETTGTYFEIRSIIINSNLRLARAHGYQISKKFGAALGKVTPDEVIHAAEDGMFPAMDLFEPRRGNKFSTYLTLWLFQSCNRYVVKNRATIHIPHNLQSRKCREGDGLTVLENESPQTAQLVRNTYRTGVSSVGLGPRSDHVKHKGYVIQFAPDPQPHVEAFTKELVDLVRAALPKLPDKQRDVLVRSFGLDGQPNHTYAEIAEVHNVSRESIRNWYLKAVKNLKAAIGDLLGKGSAPDLLS